MAADGAVFVSDRYAMTIRRISGGSVTTWPARRQPGFSDGAGGAARFNYPNGIAVDAFNNVFVADSDNHTIRKVSAAGVVTTIAGFPGQAGYLDDLGPRARFRSTQRRRRRCQRRSLRCRWPQPSHSSRHTGRSGDDVYRLDRYWRGRAISRSKPGRHALRCVLQANAIRKNLTAAVVTTLRLP